MEKKRSLPVEGSLLAREPEPAGSRAFSASAAFSLPDSHGLDEVNSSCAFEIHATATNISMYARGCQHVAERTQSWIVNWAIDDLADSDVFVAVAASNDN
jgi:hypothetical protein